MILCGAIVMPVMYMKDMRTYAQQMAEIEALEESEEADVVDNMEEAINTYKRLGVKTELLENSPIYQVDPYRTNKMTLLFEIIAKDGGNLPVLQTAYNKCITSSESLASISEAMGIEDKGYTADLINVEGSWGANTVKGALTIEIILPKGSDSQSVKKSVEKVLQEYSKELARTVGESEISIISMDEKQYVDLDIQQQQESLRQEIDSLETEMTTAEAALTDEQKAVLAKRISGGEEVEDSTALSVEEQDLVAEADPKPQMNVKYLLMGMVLGAFLYTFCFIFLILLRPRISEECEISETIGVRSLGEIRSYPAKTSWQRFFRDEKIYLKRYRHVLDTDNLRSEVAARIEMLLEDDKDCLVLPVSAMSEKASGIVQSVVGNSGKAISVFSSDQVASVALEKRLVSHPHVIIVSEAGKSSYADVDNVTGMCGNYGVQISGSLMVEG